MKVIERFWLSFCFFLLYAPILFLVVYSFNQGETMQTFDGFSWQHYQELWADTRLLQIVLNTILLALLSSLIATVIGTIGALAIFRTQRKLLKQSLLSLNNVLLVSPDVIIGAAFLILMTALGLKMGFLTVLMAHVAFSIPIVVLMVLPKLQEMNQDLALAASDLGAKPTEVLTKVTLPVISSGIFAGFFMALTYSLDDFAVTFFVTGNGFSTLAVEVYSRARQGVSLEINALSTLMLFLAFVLVLAYYAYSQKKQGQKTKLKEKVK
ncbi:ABC transporter permease [Fructobacillus sp. M1-13]|uniref:ABC transporter permease n=1 Tax=Fructobacillus papyriferae TaxID=2713171 RepID=A0ABS5QQQ9_9LACO|nr:ABC transporter permease [Fructobacillus papyriferae]MBS9335528.1 ABC transporter permease [Fructobacillus papyriferae]MCD2159382.1 ABC transporter permease [Fructobacillus papyriferae]